MKKLFIILTVALFGLSACSKDEVYEDTLEVTFLFDKTPNGGSVLDGSFGVIYKKLGGKEYYAIMEASGEKQFCPVRYKAFPETDVFRFNSRILVAVDGKRIIRLYLTNNDDLNPDRLIFETKLGYTNDSVGKIEL